MKRTLLFLPVALLIFTGCNKLEDSIKIKIEETTSITIPSSTVVNLPVNIPAPEQESSLEEELEINNSRKDKVKTISIKELNLTTTNPPGSDFSFLNSITVYIKADGLPEREIGHLDPVPANAGSTVQLIVFEDDFTDYLKSEKFSMKTFVTTDEIVTSETTVEIYSRFEVTADIF